MRYVTANSLFKGQLFAENQSLLITPSMTHFCQLEVCPQSGNLHNIFLLRRRSSAPLIDYAFFLFLTFIVILWPEGLRDDDRYEE